jgi:hypothetical protein
VNHVPLSLARGEWTLPSRKYGGKRQRERGKKKRRKEKKREE